MKWGFSVFAYKQLRGEMKKKYLYVALATAVFGAGYGDNGAWAQARKTARGWARNQPWNAPNRLDQVESTEGNMGVGK